MLMMEEQIRLDRDRYIGTEEGGMSADEELDPPAQYEDLGAIRRAEAAAKQVKKISTRQARYVSSVLSYPEVLGSRWLVERGQRSLGSRLYAHLDCCD